MRCLCLLVVVASLSMACGPAPSPQTPAATSTPAAPAAAAPFELRLVVEGTAPGQSFPGADGKSLLLEPTAVISGAHVALAEAKSSEVAMTLTPEGAKALADVTRRAKGRKLAIVVDGTVEVAPEIKTAIEGGHVIFNLRSPKDAEAFARRFPVKK